MYLVQKTNINNQVPRMQRLPKPLLLVIFTFTLSIHVSAAPGDILSSLTINNTLTDGRLPTTPQGITFHNGQLYIVDFATDRIYRTYPSDVIDDQGTSDPSDDILLFSAGDSDLNIPLTDADNPPINSDGVPIGTCSSAIPAGQYCGGGGITLALNYLWNASPITDNIIKIDPVDGDNLESENALASLAFPSPTDMAYDGTSFWIVDWQSNTINKVLPENGTIILSIPGPSTKPSYLSDPGIGSYNAKPFGIAWDGQALWVSEQSDSMIYRINPLDGSILNFFPAPGADPKGLTWDGEFLWHVDQAAQTIYKLESGVIPFGIIGCIEKNGKAVNGDVLLSQTAIADQTSTTNTDGCFIFPSFTSGTPIQVKVSESGIDEKPVITLVELTPGSTDVTLIVGDSYSEPGFTATDTEDGDITASVIATPDVINAPTIIDTSSPNPTGIQVAYDVVDSAGNLADRVYRTVYVLLADTTPPVITLLGDNPMAVELGGSYVEPGATATDDRNGDLSVDITVTGTVDALTTGSYTLSYNVVDAAGNNSTTVTRTINVSDTTIPTITLIGSNSITLEKGDSFTDPGATAADNTDGDISANIVKSGSVTVSETGTYILTYDVLDAAGNAAITRTRSIQVIDTTPPLITLIGSSPINHELSTAFTDPGATATDVPSQDLSSSIVVTGSVDVNLAGTYNLTYNVTDTNGNAATSVTRQVIVSDTGTPTITLLGNNPLEHELGNTFTDPGATASDVIDGDVTANIVVGGDVVNATLTGTYNITYNVVDSVGNSALTQTRTVNVSDSTPPLITLTGLSTVLHGLQTVYTDAGATASDNTDGDITANIVVGGDTVDTNTIGVYAITYNVNDAAGNAGAPITRIVDVADRTAPIITLLGASPLNHEVGTIFVDPGATATDNIDGNTTSKISATGSVNPNTIGSYTLTYNVSDIAGNPAVAVIRTINVVDTGAPSITLLGDSPILHELQTTFTDPGATAIDAADGDLTASIVATGAVDANIAGTYTLSYNVSDSQTNPAPTVTRDVIVADRTAPIITLSGNSTINVEQGSVYTDAGATAADIIDGDVSTSIALSGSVDANIAGTYTLNYNVSDTAGNAALQASRTVIVSDTTIPVITLINTNPLTHEVGTVFIDPGATASDNIDGDITGQIGVSGSVNPNVQGSYILTYNVADSSANTATTVTRTVNVVDTGLPSITLLGVSTVLHELQTTYTDAGATASDAADGDLTANIVVTGAVDSNIVGTYTLSYNVIDSQSNAATTVTRNVIVADRTAPTISLAGSTTVNVEQGSTYVDAGATAADLIDGDLSLGITVGGSVNPNVGGTYTLTYNVSDASGNAATQVSRTVIVSDTTRPVITLTGASPLNHEVGTIFTDPGATASDNIDGDISATIGVNGIVNANIVGSYTLSYNVSDTAGNNATTVTRTVNVADTGAPTINITGATLINHELNTAYTDAGATASDVVDDDATLTAAIVTVNNVNETIAGTYTVTYNVTDSSSNAAAQQTRTVNVGDFTAPVISLVGNSTINVELGTSYTDAGATATDNIDGILTSSIISTGSANTSAQGTYIISYNVTDAAGNNATQVIRTVIVSDKTAPIIALLGSAAINHEQGTAYSDPGASATDNIDGNITANITVSGFVDANASGTYTLSYNVSDASGNNATTVTRTITVADTTVPLLTLTGSNSLPHEQGSVFTDPGATASDSVDGDISVNIVVTGAVDINTAGSYTLTYNVSDAAGNAATAITRTVIVSDTTAPTITLIGSSAVNHEQGTAYADAGASGFDSVDGNITANIVVTGNVNTNAPGTYTLTYSLSDAAGNAGSTVTRNITVADTTAPSISLIGNSIVNHEQGTVYTDAGATASDNIDGNISANIVRTGSVNINLPGSYTLSYNVNDAAGNAATTINRTVIISDTTAPVISLAGNTTVTVEQGTSYTDAGATATDNVDGNLTTSIVVSGDIVDVNTAGTYIIRYDVTDAASNAATQVTRTVNVSDTTIPVITLIGSPTVSQAQGLAYTDAGASAADNINGDISTSIVITNPVDINTIGTYIVSYNVADSAGNNAATVTRTVNITDGIAPVITLIGDANVDHTIGQLFTDPGATASDNLDGDVSANITTSGVIDINTEGAYVLSYDVTDSAGNIATTVTRTVNVVSPVIINIEAETATIGGAHIVSTTNAGFTGSGYIEHVGEGYIEYTFNAFGVPYDLTVRFALDTGDRPLEVIVNSVSLGNLSFPATGSYTTWANTATFSITPESGANTIRLQTTSLSGANIDQLIFTPQ